MVEMTDESESVSPRFYTPPPPPRSEERRTMKGEEEEEERGCNPEEEEESSNISKSLLQDSDYTDSLEIPAKAALAKSSTEHSPILLRQSPIDVEL